MGGAALHLGNIAEMKTGEGKTLVATLPAYLNALTGKGVHVVTVNDYLAEYQSERMGRVHRFLGLRPACILASMTPAERREQYAKDITYGTNNEFGFDYLRDNMAWRTDELVQRGHNFAIVDEVDSILIDEARTPLIISGPADQPTKWYVEFARLVKRLKRGEAESGEGDYEVDEKKRTVGVLESGIAKVEDYLGIDNLYESVNTPLVGYLNNAIKAKELFKRDKDYVVMNGEVLIVDEHTGRMLAGRRYNEGMHQAIEAKEGVEIKNENQTLATITLQNYFRLYDKLSGMTGTAMTEAAELHADLQARRRRDPDQPADDPRRPARPRLPHRGRQVRRGRRRHRRAARGRPAGAGRHHRASRRASTSPTSCAGAASRTRSSTPSSTSARRRSSRRPAARAPSPSRPTWPAAAPTSCSAATPSSSRSPRSSSRGSTRSRPRRSTRPPGRAPSRTPRRPCPASTTRSSSSAASTCSAPSGTSRAGSTTSCAVAPAGRATPARAGSTSRCRTT